MEIDLLKRRINEAWADTPVPSRLIDGGDLDALDVERDYESQNWRGLDFRRVEVFSASILNYGSPEAARYFVPGYLLHALDAIGSHSHTDETACSALFYIITGKRGPLYDADLSSQQVELIIAVVDLTMENRHLFGAGFEERFMLQGIKKWRSRLAQVR